jgi:hypothetical protein
MRKVLLGAVAGQALALLACDKSTEQPAPTGPKSAAVAPKSAAVAPKPAAQPCMSLTAFPAPGVRDLNRSAHACVERTAALYAKGPDPADVLSRAVMAKCEAEVLRYVAEAARNAREKPQYPVLMESWRGHALTVIAEARARRCYG